MIWRTVTLLAIGMGAGIVGLWVADHDPPVRIIRAAPLMATVPPGGNLRIEYEIDRLRDCAARVDRMFYDANRVRFNLDDFELASAPGPLGRDRYIVPLTIPRLFAEGPAVYRTVSRYECNPLNRLWPIVAPAREVPFVVKGPAPPMPLPVEITPAP